MDEYWPGICAALALITLLILVIRYHVHPFVVLLIVSLGLGLLAGKPPDKVVDFIVVFASMDQPWRSLLDKPIRYPMHLGR